MRPRLTAVLSLAGVLAAGTAAALVNTHILKAASTSTSVATVGAGDTGTTTTTNLSTDTSVLATPSTQVAYRVGDAGTVLLDTAGDVLTLVSVTPSAGWLVVAANQLDPVNVEVQLQSDHTVVTFNAHVLFGVVSTSVYSNALDAETGTSITVSLPAPAPSSATGASPVAGSSPEPPSSPTTLSAPTAATPVATTLPRSAPSVSVAVPVPTVDDDDNDSGSDSTTSGTDNSGGDDSSDSDDD